MLICLLNIDSYINAYNASIQLYTIDCCVQNVIFRNNQKNI